MKRRARVRLVLAGALALTLLAGEVGAAAPSDQLREYVGRVLKTLADPQLRGEDRTGERRAALRKVADEAFDFGEMAKRALARHWRARTPAQQTEFAELFANLLEHAYVSKLDLYRGEKVSYLGEAVDGDLASVRTKIVTKEGTEVPVEYRMHRRGGRWLVYDVVIEGISLVANYRAQFNKLIQTSSYEQLVARMRAKEVAAPAASGATGSGPGGRPR